MPVVPTEIAGHIPARGPDAQIAAFFHPAECRVNQPLGQAPTLQAGGNIGGVEVYRGSAKSQRRGVNHVY